MKYIIMCGGKYDCVSQFRPLIKINNESLVEHTIRLLRELGISDIAVSTNSDIDLLDFLDVDVLKFKNSYKTAGYNDSIGYWCDAFYYTNDPVCYLMGDVYYSKDALRKIVETNVNKIGFFGTDTPFPPGYWKKSEEPLAFKVNDQKLFHESCDKFRKYQDMGKDKWPFRRIPISWELAQIIDNVNLKEFIKGPSFIGIHDFACDIDDNEDIERLEKVINTYKY